MLYTLKIHHFLSASPTKKQIVWVKFFVFLLSLVPLIRLFWLGLQDDLTANPVEFLERSTGYWTLFILLSTLSLTPVRLMTGRVWQLQLRRMLGLFMFFYACLHITAYMWLDFSFDWTAITKDIVKHKYVLVGFAAFVLTVPLAITSNKFMLKRLRERWKKLHQLVYFIAILGVLHFWWLVKKDIREPLLYAVILFFLLGIRIYFKYSKQLNKVDC
ncbi:sulfoxide reductase heme-binding subunit YedZ [mine drainage metagenome]|uniref:Sulfoxide reductase heme-binding subunit YedZ n=1 Tax=mine drainage metagenome TaxID=410659 RepID=A0A1J5U029_9ZZZZ